MFKNISKHYYMDCEIVNGKIPFPWADCEFPLIDLYLHYFMIFQVEIYLEKVR